MYCQCLVVIEFNSIISRPTINVCFALFTAWRHASAVYTVVVGPSVTRRYCIKTAKRRIKSSKQRRTIAQGLYFSEAKTLGEIQTGSFPTGALNTGGVGWLTFWPNCTGNSSLRSKQRKHYQNDFMLRNESDKVCFSPYLFNILAEMVLRETLDWFQGGLQIGGRI